MSEVVLLPMAPRPPKMTPAEFWNACRNDFLFYARWCLKIRVKRGNGYRLEPFIPNMEQRQVLIYLLYCLRNRVPVRVIIDKCRRLGMSTLIEAIAFWLCCFHPHFRAMVIAHLQKSTEEIADITRVFAESLPEPVARRLRPRAVGHTLFWDRKGQTGSKFTAVTQGSTDAARGGEAVFLHLSELAFWDQRRSTTSAEATLTAVLAAMLVEPFTFVIIESTGMGAGTNAFFQRFRQAWSNRHNKGPGDWHPFFFSWTGVPKYTMQVRPEVEETHAAMLRHAAMEQMEKAQECAVKLKYPELWFHRSIDHNLTAGETAWAIAKSGDFGDIGAFDQEFPITWQMSFQASGRPVFWQKQLDAWRLAGRPDGTTYGGALFTDEGGQTKLDGIGSGWEIYRKPELLHHYVVATDSAEGSSASANADGDNAVVKVFDRNTREVVGRYYGRQAPEETGEQAVIAASWFNKAMIIPEIDQHGFATVQKIRELGYMHVWRRNMRADVQAGQSWASYLGFKRTRENRPRLLDELRKQVRLGLYTEYSQTFIDEAEAYQFSAHGRADHMPGAHDDEIQATTLLFEADAQLLSVDKTPQRHNDESEPESLLERARREHRERNMGKGLRGRRR